MRSPDVTQDLPQTIRRRARSGALSSHTTSLASGYVQANLVILPGEYSEDFLRFCHRNPKPCPLLAVSEPGHPFLEDLGEDLDVRTDLPAYRVLRDGRISEERTSIEDLWQGDFVAFALGCSLSFEEALGQAGLPQPYLEDDQIVPVYFTDIACRRAGVFQGCMAVSMRPFHPADAIRAIQVTGRYGRVHGAPVHLGDPQLIGISSLEDPYFGTPLPVAVDQLPVFWACGVTPERVIRDAQLPFCITHKPAHMLVTNVRNVELTAP